MLAQQDYHDGTNSPASHKYTLVPIHTTDFNAYPEEIPDVWRPRYTNYHGQVVNPNRTIQADMPPADFNGYNPISRRAELQCFMTPLDDEAKKNILKNATSREYFHDYDRLHNPFGMIPECLCELRFATGELCKEHLIKGADGKTIDTPGNQHWAWFIDICPRGYVCPRALQRHRRDIGGPPLAGCKILLFNRPPPEEWVLAQMEADPEGIVAGRACTDVCIPGRKCLRCDGLLLDETNQFIGRQGWKYDYHGQNKPGIQPLVRKPKTEAGAHPLLQANRGDHLHHAAELLKFPGVEAEDIWLPNVKVGENEYGTERGLTMEQWQNLLAMAQGDEGDAETQDLFKMMEIDWANELSAGGV